MEDFRLHLAGQWIRLANSIIDLISILVLWTLFTVGLVLLGVDQFYKDEQGQQIPLLPLVILLPTFWLYYLLTEFYFQQTLGKKITKTKVVTVTGDKPNFTQILGRTISRSIPFEYLSYLGTTSGIHDRLSGTRVVNV